MTDAKGRPIRMFLSAGQTSDYTGAAALVRSLPKAGVLLAPSQGLHANHCRATDRGHDTNWFRNTLTDMGIQPWSPSRRSRRVPVEYDADLYKKRHKIENTFARIKDWQRVATRYGRCADLFLSACAHAAVVMFWL